MFDRIAKLFRDREELRYTPERNWEKIKDRGSLEIAARLARRAEVAAEDHKQHPTNLNYYRAQCAPLDLRASELLIELEEARQTLEGRDAAFVKQVFTRMMDQLRQP